MQQLESAKRALEKTADALEALGVTYWIDSGTLLSAYRDKSINIYDHDIDVRVYEDEAPDERIGDIVKALWLADWVILINDKPIKAQILCVSKENITLDFKFCHRDKKHVWYYCWREPDPAVTIHLYPRKFFDTLGSIELFGRKYPCPQPIEEYIAHHYGPDWREFKVRPEQAGESDLTWDYMKHPPCAMTLGEFYDLKSNTLPEIYIQGSDALI